MTDFHGFKGRAKRLDDIDLPKLGHQIGVGEDELHAFMDVEAAGSPFDGSGRPKMLFEPHRFYALLGKGAKRDRAVGENLAYAKWGTQPYPNNSYPRLLKAMQIDETKALMAASWGLTQIMAEWFTDCGYASPQGMVTAFMDDAENHLNSTIRLLVKWKLDDDLRRLRALSRPTVAADCEQIADTWNGPAYKKHNYHGRIATAHNKWRKIKNTPWTSDQAEPTAVPPDVPAPAAEAPVRGLKAVQEQLIKLGYYDVGKADGRPGTKTRGAVLAFRSDNDLPLTENWTDADFVKALFSDAKPREIAPARATAELADLRKSGSTIIASTDAIKGIGTAVAGTGAVAGVAQETGVIDKLREVGDTVGQVTDAVGPFQMLFSIFADFWWIPAICIGGGVVWFGVKAARARLADYRSGKTA